MKGLRQRGVQFEDYDFPGFDKATGIADVGGTRAPGVREWAGIASVPCS
jgi:hypothetical protein